MAEVLPVADPASIESCTALLRDGGAVVVPTDTVYGIVVDAFATEATQGLFALRGASRENPLTVAIRNPRQLMGLTSGPGEQAERLVAAFWPGPLTLVFPAGEALTWDLGETDGTVAIRLPDDAFLHEVIAEVGPLALTSANTVGTLPPSTVREARALLGDRVAGYVDGGTRRNRPSTIVDVSRGGAEVLRRGAISADEIFDVATGVVDWGAPSGSVEAAELARPAETADPEAGTDTEAAAADLADRPSQSPEPQE